MLAPLLGGGVAAEGGGNEQLVSHPQPVLGAIFGIIRATRDSFPDSICSCCGTCQLQVENLFMIRAAASCFGTVEATRDSLLDSICSCRGTCQLQIENFFMIRAAAPCFGTVEAIRDSFLDSICSCCGTCQLQVENLFVIRAAASCFGTVEATRDSFLDSICSCCGTCQLQIENSFMIRAALPAVAAEPQPASGAGPAGNEDMGALTRCTRLGALDEANVPAAVIVTPSTGGG